MISRHRLLFARCVCAISRYMRPLVVAGVATATHLMFDVGIVLAQAKDAKEEEVKSWVFPYALVITLIGLGMLAVCRPSNRADDLPIHKKAKRK